MEKEKDNENKNCASQSCDSYFITNIYSDVAEETIDNDLIGYIYDGEINLGRSLTNKKK